MPDPRRPNGVHTKCTHTTSCSASPSFIHSVWRVLQNRSATLPSGLVQQEWALSADRDGLQVDDVITCLGAQREGGIPGIALIVPDVEKGMLYDGC